MHRLGLIFAVFLSGALGGCQTLSAANTTKLATPLKTSLAASDIGTGLDDKTRLLAANTEYRALETGRAGAPVAWKASDRVFGSVTPQQPYSVGTTNCRRYTHSITINGSARSATATACRSEDGIWTPLT